MLRRLTLIWRPLTLLWVFLRSETGESFLLIAASVIAEVVSDEGVTVGPILLGCTKPVHIPTPTSAVRRLVNVTALAAVGAGH